MVDRQKERSRSRSLEKEKQDSKNKKEWYFEIDVSEGQPGFSDSDYYKSAKFFSFADCYEKYLTFNPDGHWPFLRSVESEKFCYILNGTEIGEVKLTKNWDQTIDPSKLGISESELNEIMAGIKNKNDTLKEMLADENVGKELKQDYETFISYEVNLRQREAYLDFTEFCFKYRLDKIANYSKDLTGNEEIDEIIKKIE